MPERPEDPVLKSSRREAVVALLLFAAACVWTLLYTALRGYGRKAETLTFVLGMPDWVFWGILLPWGASFVAAFWFAYGFMKDEDLGQEKDAGSDG